MEEEEKNSLADLMIGMSVYEWGVMHPGHSLKWGQLRASLSLWNVSCGFTPMGDD